MDKRKGGRPRDDLIPEVVGDCPVHGRVIMRVHKIGFRGSVQRYRVRCPLCHAERELARTKAKLKHAHDPRLSGEVDQ